MNRKTNDFGESFCSLHSSQCYSMRLFKLTISNVSFGSQSRSPQCLKHVKLEGIKVLKLRCKPTKLAPHREQPTRLPRTLASSHRWKAVSARNREVRECPWEVPWVGGCPGAKDSPSAAAIRKRDSLRCEGEVRLSPTESMPTGGKRSFEATIIGNRGRFSWSGWFSLCSCRARRQTLDWLVA